MQQTGPNQYVSVWTWRDTPPLHAFPPVLQEAMREVISKLNVPPEAAAFAASSTLALASQGNVDVQRPGGGSPMPTSQMNFYVDTSSTGKSLVMRHFMKPARELGTEFGTHARLAAEDHAIRLKLWKQRHEKLVAQCDTATRSKSYRKAAKAREALDEHLANRPTARQFPRFTTIDATVAGVFRAYSRWPSFALESTEGSTVTKSEIMERNEYVNLLLDGEGINRDRGHELHQMPDARISFVVVTHPDTNQEFIERLGRASIGNGFLPRADFYFPDPDSSKVGFREIATSVPDLPCVAAMQKRVREQLLHSIEEKMAGTYRRRTLRLSPGAELLWRDFAQTNENESAPGRLYSRCPAAASKSAEKVLRHAAGFHDHAGEASDLISAETMGAAILLASYNLRRWFTYMQQHLESPEVGYARQILKCLKAHLMAWRPDLIRQSYIHPRVHASAGKQPNFEQGLDVLELNNYLRREYYPGQRGAVKWLRLNRELILSSPC